MRAAHGHQPIVNRRPRALLRQLAAWPALASASLSSAWGQDYPSRTVTVVNPYCPGAGVDPERVNDAMG